MPSHTFHVMHADGPVADDAAGTRVGGLPLLPPGTPWPRCADDSCRRNLAFMGQIDLSGTGPAAPAEASAEVSVSVEERNGSVLALFHCLDWCVQTGTMYGSSHAAFLFPCAGLVATEPPGGSEGPLDREGDRMVLPAAGIAVTPIEVEPSDDPDDPEDDPPVSFYQGRDAWVDREGHPYADFLGQWAGAPTWIQDDDTPECAACGHGMDFVAQFNSSDRHYRPVYFGDYGYGYVFACEPCGTAAFHVQD
ncbi:hypothetical protein [Nocardiopsis aegyptia]|uniref:Ribosomal protein L37E n=1 Tax=Nocardiopsis aegyptia TaxID=220378 RepID=A0A7Z0JCR8_9ACTN|nr:hypothetical protein [Nocardiopsis aegyptia]NYJ37531.1 ribosomal protein L37E [Nocardiopsis aegyptia]